MKFPNLSPCETLLLLSFKEHRIGKPFPTSCHLQGQVVLPCFLIKCILLELLSHGRGYSELILFHPQAKEETDLDGRALWYVTTIYWKSVRDLWSYLQGVLAVNHYNKMFTFTASWNLFKLQSSSVASQVKPVHFLGHWGVPQPGFPAWKMPFLQRAVMLRVLWLMI